MHSTTILGEVIAGPRHKKKSVVTILQSDTAGDIELISPRLSSTRNSKDFDEEFEETQPKAISRIEQLSLPRRKARAKKFAEISSKQEYDPDVKKLVEGQKPKRSAFKVINDLNDMISQALMNVINVNHFATKINEAQEQTKGEIIESAGLFFDIVSNANQALLAAQSQENVARDRALESFFSSPLNGYDHSLGFPSHMRERHQNNKRLIENKKNLRLSIPKESDVELRAHNSQESTPSLIVTENSKVDLNFHQRKRSQPQPETEQIQSIEDDCPVNDPPSSPTSTDAIKKRPASSLYKINSQLKPGD